MPLPAEIAGHAEAVEVGGLVKKAQPNALADGVEKDVDVRMAGKKLFGNLLVEAEASPCAARPGAQSYGEDPGVMLFAFFEALPHRKTRIQDSGPPRPGDSFIHNLVIQKFLELHDGD